METKQEGKIINKVEETKRAKTVSLTAKQIREIGNDKELSELIANQIDNSEGNLKGNLAFAIAKAIKQQQKLKI